MQLEDADVNSLLSTSALEPDAPRRASLTSTSMSAVDADAPRRGCFDVNSSSSMSAIDALDALLNRLGNAHANCGS